MHPNSSTSQLLGALLCIAVSVASVQSQESDPTQGQVDQLVRLLSHSQLTRRGQAHQALIDMGPAVLDLLPPESTQLPAEAISRLKSIRQDLYKQVAKQSTAATPISMTGDYKLEEVLNQLELQGGIEFKTDADTEQLIDVAFDQQPFWEVVDAVLDFAKLDIAPFGAEHLSQFVLVDRHEDSAPRSELARYEGVFRIAPVRVSKSKSFTNPAVDSTQLFIHVAWEPGIQPVLMQLALKDLKAVDSTGKDISPQNKDTVRTINLEGERRSAELSIPLLPANSEARAIRSLSGRFETLLPARSEAFEFSINGLNNAALPLVYTKAGVDVVLQSFKHDKEKIICDLKVHYKSAGRAFESHRGWVFKNPCVLVDSDGNKQQPLSRDTIGQGENFVTFRYEFKPTNEIDLDNDCVIRYFTPTLLVERDVPFMLLGIPLP